MIGRYRIYRASKAQLVYPSFQYDFEGLSVVMARPADRTIHQHPHPAITGTPWCTGEVFHHGIDGISKLGLR
jgi:hypothetical protein